ncbi:hypothetical protein D3C81_2127290 [compost metagenome]
MATSRMLAEVQPHLAHLNLAAIRSSKLEASQSVSSSVKPSSPCSAKGSSSSSTCSISKIPIRQCGQRP